MLSVLDSEREQAMIEEKIMKYIGQMKSPTFSNGANGDTCMNKQDTKRVKDKIQYQTLRAWENADPCDDPEYVKAMYGVGGIYGTPVSEQDLEEILED